MRSNDRRVWYRLPDGRATRSPELVETPTGWVQPPPISCPAGHPLTAGSYVVGWQACRTQGCGGHIAYTCQECGKAVYVPERREGCGGFAFDGRGDAGA